MNNEAPNTHIQTLVHIHTHSHTPIFTQSCVTETGSKWAYRGEQMGNIRLSGYIMS